MAEALYHSLLRLNAIPLYHMHGTTHHDHWDVVSSHEINVIPDHHLTQKDLLRKAYFLPVDLSGVGIVDL